MRLLVCVAPVLAVLGACGDVNQPVAVGDTTTTEAPMGASEDEPFGALEAPPTVTVRSATTTLELEPWTFCYGGGCADGRPASDLPDIGDADELAVEFPLQDWQFTATFEPAGVDCPRQHSVPLERGADGTFMLSPVGPADSYNVTLFGQGDGDLFVTFLWKTTEDGPLATPEARLAVIADHDGEPDSYGIELVLSNLSSTPADAMATITVAPAEGEALSFVATRATGCLAEGTVYWDGPDEQGVAAARLGEPPFTYEVEITLDGISYRATATWPDDQIEGNEPSVALSFVPPLPAL